MGRKNIACLMRRSRPPGSGYYAKAALASLFSLRCCSLAWRRRRSLRARSQSQAILDRHSCSRRDHRALPSIRGRTSTDAARDGTSCSIVRRRFQALCGILGCRFRTRARHSQVGKARICSGSAKPLQAINLRGLPRSVQPTAPSCRG
jgi:hypothetical protein